jgi:hypothetical protein
MKNKKVAAFKVQIWETPDGTWFHVISRLRRFGFATFWRQIDSVWNSDEIGHTMQMSMFDKDEAWEK